MSVAGGHAAAMPRKSESALAASVASQIRIVRGQRVLLGSDLAALYGTTTKAFNQAVRRNSERFPRDFVLQLTAAEVESSRSQFVTLNAGRGHNIKYRPLAFTEHGAIMAAMVLNSPRAIEMSVYVVRAFIRLKAVLASNAQLARELETLRKSVAALDADTKRQFDQVYEAILGLMNPAVKQ